MEWKSRLKDILDEQGRSQAWLAKQVNVYDKTLRNWVNGKNHPPANKLFEIAEILNVDVRELYVKIE
jgi:putative transcriptional regulator